MIKIGSYVKVPAVKGHISSVKNKGYVTAITPRYCVVSIKIGRQRKGVWGGKIKDVTELEIPTIPTTTELLLTCCSDR